MLSQIVNHPDLNQLFTSSEKVEVERKIITSKGAVLIPDRLNINEAGEITITDYKTGKYQKKT
jgi:RecB family exonuclease